MAVWHCSWRHDCSARSRNDKKGELLMEQRIYHGNVTSEGLANYVVQRFDPQHDLQAQKLGEGDSLVVQIGRGDTPEEIRHAVTLGITRAPDSEQGVAVTMG